MRSDIWAKPNPMPESITEPAARHVATAAGFQGMRWPPEVASMDLIVAGGISGRDYLASLVEDGRHLG